jgi:fatty acid desaturase
VPSCPSGRGRLCELLAPSSGALESSLPPRAVLVGYDELLSLLRNRTFPRIAAWAAIVANLLGLALFAPGIGVLLSIVSVVILIAWYLLVGWRLLRLDALPGDAEATHEIGEEMLT